MIADRFRGLVQSSAARQAAFEETRRHARIAAVERARGDLLGAAYELRNTPGPLAESAVAHFLMATEATPRCTDVAEFEPWIADAVRCARAVLLGGLGATS